MESIELVSGADRNDISCTITFGFPAQLPMLIWKVEILNGGTRPVYLDRVEMFNSGFIHADEIKSSVSPLGKTPQARGAIKIYPKTGELAFFSNGWQTWSYTGVFKEFDRFKQTRLGPLRVPAIVNPGTPHRSRIGQFSSDMFGVLCDITNRSGILAGFLSQVQHFGSLEALLGSYGPAMRMWANGDQTRLDPNMPASTDWACLIFLDLDEPDPLGCYVEAVARENGLSPDKPDQKIPAGWCSWYQYFKDLSEAGIQANLVSIKQQRDRLPLNLFQIDDGFESRWGDWTEFSPSFPNGVAGLAAEIEQSGMVPGLWLAPYIVERKSRLAKENPQWLLRNERGQPVNAGFFWGGFTTALDLTSPGALEYASEVVGRAVHEWGFTYLKLDFLYAAAIRGRYHNPYLSRAQVLRKGLAALRGAAGKDATLLGCGCPLGPAVGLFDLMRIGADVDVRWTPAHKGVSFFFNRETDLPSARNAVQNALTRAALHRRWWINDPDCLLLRPETLLSEHEVRSRASLIALTGGSLLISDELAEVPPHRLRLAEVLLPLIGQRPSVPDLFDAATPERLRLDLKGPVGAWHVVGLYNWSDRPKNLAFQLEQFDLDIRQEYIARSFWDDQVYRIAPPMVRRRSEPGKEDLLFNDVPAHGCVILALRAVDNRQPQYLGSSLHISQGLEVAGWYREGPASLALRLERPGPASGVIAVTLPGSPESIQAGGQPLAFHKALIPGFEREYYRIPVEFNRSMRIQINYRNTISETDHGR
jgi:alpha-galactosidase